MGVIPRSCYFVLIQINGEESMNNLKYSRVLVLERGGGGGGGGGGLAVDSKPDFCIILTHTLNKEKHAFDKILNVPPVYCTIRHSSILPK